MKRHRPWLHSTLAIAIVAAILAAQRCTTVDRAVKAAKNNEDIWDFGRVNVAGGPQELEHTFLIRNIGREELAIEGLNKSCGCLRADLAERRIRPGQATTLTLAFQVSDLGFKTQHATVVLSDGTTRTFSVRAHGVVNQECTAIVSRPELDAQSNVHIRLQLVDSTGDGESEPPELLAPAGATMTFAGWRTLELHSQLPSRPTRQLANVVVDFSRYAGPFPVTVTFRCAGGATCDTNIDRYGSAATCSE